MSESEYVVTEHALLEMKRRGLTVEMVQSVLDSPEQRVGVRTGRVVLQSRIRMGEPAKLYLLRVFVDVDRKPAEVVTVYSTSRIEKYWRQQP